MNLKDYTNVGIDDNLVSLDSLLNRETLSSTSVADMATSITESGTRLLTATHDLVFSVTDADTVAWAAGTIYLKDGTFYAIAAGNTGNMAAETFIYFDLDVSKVALQLTTTKSDADGQYKILIAIAQNAVNEALFKVYNSKEENMDGGNIRVGSITTTELNFTPATSSNVIATINASAEGIRIDADNIAISGSTSFSSGYDPTGRVLAVGGTYDSAALGARVRIFPDVNTGIQVIDDGGADVFKVIVGGTDVGDVIQGNYAGGQGVKYDKSAGTYDVKAILTANAGSSIATTYLSGTIAQANLNVSDRGWSQTCAFTSTDLNTVTWGAGTFTSADGTAYSILTGNTGNMAAKTYIYLDIAVSTTAYQITTTSSTAVGAGKVLIAVAQNAAVTATYALTETSQIVGDNILANTIDASKIITGQLIVGTNVGIGTAQDSAGVTTIVGNVVTTGFVNALNVNAATVSASISITTPTITGGTITIGTGNNVFIAGASGIQLGHATFGSAPFSVSMAGALIATSATITGALTTGVGSSINGTYIDSLNVNKLLAGTITSKAITLAISGGTGDVKIQAGKTDFGDTTSGFILGMDDSDGDLAKFEIGNDTDFWSWNGVKTTMSQGALIDFYTDKICKTGNAKDLSNTMGSGATTWVTTDYLVNVLDSNDANGGGDVYNSSILDGSKNFGFGAVAKFTVSGNQGVGVFGVHNGNAWGGVGYQSSTADQAVISYDNSDSKLRFTTASSATQETTEITGITVTNYNYYKILKTASSVKCFVNGVLKATHATRIPTDTTMNMLFACYTGPSSDNMKLEFYDNFTISQAI